VQLPVDNGQHLRFSSRNFGSAPDGAATLAPIPQERFDNRESKWPPKHIILRQKVISILQAKNPLKS